DFRYAHRIFVANGRQAAEMTRLRRRLWLACELLMHRGMRRCALKRAFAYRAPLMLAGLFAVVSATSSHDANACGCFTPPDPSVPIVQAGERILFSIADGQVTAHIQIQYAGKPGDFGWILPLPSQPAPLELGTDEL